MNIGEVAAPATRDQNFLAGTARVIEHGDAAPALAGFDGAHQARCSSAENQCVEMVDHARTEYLSGLSRVISCDMGGTPEAVP